MNRHTILFGISSLLIAHLSSAQSQDPGTPILVPGKIIYNDSTIVDAQFEMVEFSGGYSVEYLQKKVHYLDKNGKRKKLRPKNAEEIRYLLKGHEMRMITRRVVHHSNKKRFIHLLTDGNVRLYEYIKTYRKTGRSMRYATSRTAIYWYLERKNAKLLAPHAFHFRRQMTKYFIDCPALVRNIEDKVFVLWQIPDIVNFYNHDCP